MEMCIIDRFCKKSITLTVVLLIFVVCLQREKSSNNMKYEFNTKRFAELIAERKLKKTTCHVYLAVRIAVPCKTG